MYLYIHGFLSSPQSAKAQYFASKLSETGDATQWLCPQLPVDPREAIKLLNEIIDQCTTPPTLIGSSLGGFYASILSQQRGLKAVLINPASSPARLLKDYIGIHKAWHSDAIVELTEEHIDALEELELELGALERPELLLVLIELGDEIIDHRETRRYYRGCKFMVYTGGNHSFTRVDEAWKLIESFATQNSCPLRRLRNGEL